MKILWITNIVLPIIANDCKITVGVGGGWLTGISTALTAADNTKLIVCFPHKGDILTGTTNNIRYYSFPRHNFYSYNKKTENYLYEVLSAEKPDVIHIFGTEFPHSLAAVNAAERCGMLNKTVISIQGLVSVYAKHYFAGLPSYAIHKYTFRDLLKLDNIWRQRKKYALRGKFEIATIKKAQHIIGRTDWDKACVLSINPNAEYHFCNEILRNEFYKGKWEYEKCEKHSIFIGNSYYPIKGLHCVLEVMPNVLRRFPDAKVYVPGQNPFNIKGLKGVLHRTYYQVYIKKLIIHAGIQSNIVFLGNLSAEEMKNRMLKSNVFILPSSIENSPNTLGEAMILGVPCIAADVGGVRNMVVDKTEALIYPFDESYILPLYIGKVFNNCSFANQMSDAAQKHAIKTHDKEKNCDRLFMIYNSLVENSSIAL